MKKILMIMLLTVIFTGCSSANKNSALTLDEAKEIALKEVEGQVTKAKQDRDDGKDYYDFTIITDSEKYEVEVDANTGEIIKKEKDDDYIVNNNQNNQTTNPDNNQNSTDNNQNNTNNNGNNNNNNNVNNPTQTTISASEAQNIALNQVGGGYLTKCELDHDDGLTVYEIEIKNGNKEYDVEINAATGEIIKYEIDIDD